MCIWNLPVVFLLHARVNFPIEVTHSQRQLEHVSMEGIAAKLILIKGFSCVPPRGDMPHLGYELYWCLRAGRDGTVSDGIDGGRELGG